MSDGNKILDIELFIKYCEKYNKWEKINEFSQYWQIECLKHYPKFIIYITNRTREMCNLVFEIDSLALKYFPEELVTEELYRYSVKRHSLTLSLVPDRFKTPDLCYLAVKNCAIALQCVPEELRTEEICLLAVINNGLALKNVPDQLKTRDLCVLALEKNRGAIKFVPEHLKEIGNTFSDRNSRSALFE
ncbi:MAG: DUF4116 domain-containing protein [Patescibacteria group bacterium]